MMKVYNKSCRTENSGLTAILNLMMDSDNALDVLKMAEKLSSEDIQNIQSCVRFEKESLALVLSKLATLENVLSAAWLEVLKNEKGRVHNGIQLFKIKR